MPRLMTKAERASLAEAFVLNNSIVEYRHNLYMPVHFMTKEPGPSAIDETVWVLLDSDALRQSANDNGLLFASGDEERSYRLMIRQFSQKVKRTKGLLVRMGETHVALLNDKGELVPTTGAFVPNYLDVPYVKNNPLSDELFKVISEWVDGKEQASSLLFHIATALQPTWSAVKYLLLIGEGRNGKGTLLKMIYTLFGESQNISKITRQDMAAKSAIIATLNGKLLNVVFDGPKEFLKDSSTEKTIIAGEPIDLELKYENTPIEVMTNALMIEALNQEPLVSDKTPALQKRLARFQFPNVYKKDYKFEDKMLDEKMLAAFLDLLIKHWVNKDEVGEKLQLTAQSLDMQLQAVWSASPLLRFLEWISGRDTKFLNNVVAGKVTTEDFLNAYRPWLDENGYKNMEDSYLLKMLDDHFVTARKTFRPNGKPTTKRYIKSVRADTLNAINLLLRGEPIEGSPEDIQVLKELE